MVQRNAYSNKCFLVHLIRFLASATRIKYDSFKNSYCSYFFNFSSIISCSASILQYCTTILRRRSIRKYLFYRFVNLKIYLSSVHFLYHSSMFVYVCVGEYNYARVVSRLFPKHLKRQKHMFLLNVRTN